MKTLTQIIAAVILGATALTGKFNYSITKETPQKIQQVPKKAAFSFTEQEVVTVLKGLQELPFKEAADLYFKIQADAVKQFSQQAAPVQPKDTTKPKGKQ